MVELDQDPNYYTQVDDRGSWFYEAIGNTAGMQGRTLNFGQVYLETSKDKDGNWLDGGKTYRMRVPANPPVVQFWSFTLYDNVTRGPVVTDQGAADMSSRQNLAANPDGSVDLYFGPTKPAQAQNWVKTIPGKGWFPYFRFAALAEFEHDLIRERTQAGLAAARTRGKHGMGASTLSRQRALSKRDLQPVWDRQDNRLPLSQVAERQKRQMRGLL